MSDDIEIRITAPGASAAATEIERTTRSVEDLGRVGRTAGDVVSGLGDAFGHLGITMSASQALGMVKEWTLDADRLADSLATLNGRTVEFASTLTYGAITQMDAAAARSRLLAAGLDLTDRQFGALTVKAAAFAQGSGQEASAVLGQLTGALVAGRDRGLLPFVGALEEGASKADLQREALRRLTDESAANERQIAENAGTLDVLGLGWQRVKEQTGATYLTMLDAPFSTLLPAIGELNRGLSGQQGLDTALEKVATKFLALNAAVPGAGGQIASMIASALGLTDASNQAAAATQRLAAGMRAVARAGRGFNMAADVEGQAANDGVDDFYTAQRQGREGAFGRDLGDPSTVGTGERLIDTSYGAGRAQRRGGGGGGGSRRPNDYFERFIERREREQDARNREEAAQLWGPVYQAANEREAVRRGLYGVGPNPASNDPNASTRGALGREGQERAARGMTNAVERQQTAYERLGERGEAVLSSLNSAWESHFAAFSKGEESFGKAMRGMAAAALESLALQSLKEAGFQTAKGIAALASFNYGGAALHFAAAAAFGLVAGGAYAGSAAVAPASSSARSGGSEFRTPTSSTSLGQRSANDGGGPPINIYLSPGAIVGVGGGDQHAAGNWLADQIEGAHLRRNRQRRIRDAA